MLKEVLQAEKATTGNKTKLTKLKSSLIKAKEKVSIFYDFSGTFIISSS